MTREIRIRSWLSAGAFAVAALAGASAQAQSFCSSDGVPQPSRLLERFISADCDACWSAGAPKPAAGELALDWIVPGSRGDDAPLSAAANRDASARLASLQRAAPATHDAMRHRVQSPRRGLRVSQGLPFNGYLGTSIELKSPGPGAWSGWLLLVETLAAGSDGTPIERNLVRNALQVAWADDAGQAREHLARLYEARSMSVPEGAKPQRLRLVGWVEDGHGRMRAIAQSRCAPAGPGG